MGEERTEVAGRELARWLIVAALIAAGVILFFRLARTTEPVVHPSAPEAAP